MASVGVSLAIGVVFIEVQVRHEIGQVVPIQDAVGKLEQYSIASHVGHSL